jgi:hypothetical protein
MMKVIAHARSKGGRLDCGHLALLDQNIFKVDVGKRGGTTKAGHGLGDWYCERCVQTTHLTQPPSPMDPTLLRLYRCSNGCPDQWADADKPLQLNCFWCGERMSL